MSGAHVLFIFFYHVIIDGKYIIFDRVLTTLTLRHHYFHILR